MFRSLPLSHPAERVGTSELVIFFSGSQPRIPTTTHVPWPLHPFTNSKNLVVIQDDKINVEEEESQLYDELLCGAQSPSLPPVADVYHRPRTMAHRPAFELFKDIWLGGNSGSVSLAFTWDKHISGWTSMGDKLGDAYIGVSSHSWLHSARLMHRHRVQLW